MEENCRMLPFGSTHVTWCADDSYLIDGGKANPYYNGNMMQCCNQDPII